MRKRALSLLPLLWLPVLAGAAVPARAAAPLDVIVDTDIGDDIDDAFALALVLRSPELRIDAITTSVGDTALRARLVVRMLRAAGRPDLAVAAGPATPACTRFTQRAWAAAEAPPAGGFEDAVTATLGRLRAAPPGTITLIGLAPLTSVGAMIERDPVAFRRLARVVLMAGSIVHGYGRRAGTVSAHPSIEYNVRCDPDGLRRLLASGVPVELLPLDATEVALEAADRQRLLGRHTPLTDTLAALYSLWARGNPWGDTPTLFDVVPVARLLRPSVCAPVPMRLVVTAAGATRAARGRPNVSACLTIDRAAVVSLLQRRLAAIPR